MVPSASSSTAPSHSPKRGSPMSGRQWDTSRGRSSSPSNEAGPNGGGGTALEQAVPPPSCPRSDLALGEQLTGALQCRQEGCLVALLTVELRLFRLLLRSVRLP